MAADLCVCVCMYHGEPLRSLTATASEPLRHITAQGPAHQGEPPCVEPLPPRPLAGETPHTNKHIATSVLKTAVPLVSAHWRACCRGDRCERERVLCP
eukprot:365426-Chlamydomonas_euryale.AAC.3